MLVNKILVYQRVRMYHVIVFSMYVGGISGSVIWNIDLNPMWI